ncbi:hypothetical protein B566_EDAN012055, partial [Ephemera danica]
MRSGRYANAELENEVVYQDALGDTVKTSRPNPDQLGVMLRVTGGYSLQVIQTTENINTGPATANTSTANVKCGAITTSKTLNHERQACSGNTAKTEGGFKNLQLQRLAAIGS